MMPDDDARQLAAMHAHMDRLKADARFLTWTVRGLYLLAAIFFGLALLWR